MRKYWPIALIIIILLLRNPVLRGYHTIHTFLEERQCLNEGGKFGFTIGPSYCSMPTTDSENICNDSIDCEGICIPNEETIQKSYESESFEPIGMCSSWTIYDDCRTPRLHEGEVLISCS